MKLNLFLLAVLLQFSATAQNAYKYHVDLKKISNDKLPVELAVPQLKHSTLEFTFPKIIPGTYRVADYGMFVNEVKAFDKSGKLLPVKKSGTNKWIISNATALARITYMVEDIFDTEKSHHIYPMAATNFEENNIVLHTPGIFGFFEGHTNLPFEIVIDKQERLYGATSMKPVKSSSNQDVFKTANLNELYESPVMYTVPDTTSVTVGNAKVLVSVYSPNRLIRSDQIAEWMSKLLQAAKNYLGGKLPTDKYAFLFYFRDNDNKHSFPPGLGGALEHPASSFYYMGENPADAMKNTLVDIASHEFFHIVTPLTIASKEVKEFNYSKPVLSKHLWLYEGSTEYTAHHVQVKYGLKTITQFLNELSEKITVSRTAYNDRLPFTELSRHAAGKHEQEYGNVYQKGALIAASLDLLLLDLSDGQYSFRDLTQDLGVRFGKEKAFEDEKLFDEIEQLTYPQVKEFLEKYVDGSKPIPYGEYLELAGYQLIPHFEKDAFTLGGFSPGLKNDRIIFIHPQSEFDEFGKSLGYMPGDELYEFNGMKLSVENFMSITENLKRNMKKGDLLTVKVGRENTNGVIDTLTLSSKAFKVRVVEENKIVSLPQLSRKQQIVRAAWLTTEPPPAEAFTADPKDVQSIDAIIKSLYDVISGPAGPRNWSRFQSLFFPDAMMGAVSVNPSGDSVFRTMTPQDYMRTNGPLFMQSGFFEEELDRKVYQTGNVAVVESTYQYRFSPDGPVQKKGVNYFTLVRSNGQWKVMNLSWTSL